MYETLPAKTVALETLADKLEDAHDGMDNYYNEPPIMQEILGFCRRSADIPKEVLPKLVRVVFRCRIGRGLSYRDGVSPSGQPLYDKFFSMMDDNGIIFFILAIFHPNINSKLDNTICQKHLKSILNILLPIAISDRLKETLEYLQTNLSKANKANRIAEFRDLSSPYIEW